MGQSMRKEKKKQGVARNVQPEVRRPKPPEPSPLPSPERWTKPAGLSRWGFCILGLLVLLTNFPLLHHALLRSEPEGNLPLPYTDDFSRRETVEEHYWNSGGHWRVINGELLSPGVRNNPLWLKAKLPNDVAVEFDVRSQSPEGDIKAEIFGNGSDHASGYVLIHGGWGNSVSVIARLDEHGTPLTEIQREADKRAAERKLPSNKPEDTGVFKKDTHLRVEAQPYKVEIGRTYHWRIERRGSLLSWFIDGKPFMSFDDPFPLTGKGHDRFGFSSWEADLFFDNLKIQPLSP